MCASVYETREAKSALPFVLIANRFAASCVTAGTSCYKYLVNYIIYSNARVGSWLAVHHIQAHLPDHRVQELFTFPGQQYVAGPPFAVDRPSILKTHGKTLPQDPSQFHCVYLSRRDEWAQWCSAMLAYITGEYTDYTDQPYPPRQIRGSFMVDTIQGWRSYTRWMFDEAQHVGWHQFTHLVYEDVLQTPELLCSIVGDEPHIRTPRSTRDYRDIILNWRRLRRLYRARLCEK